MEEHAHPSPSAMPTPLAALLDFATQAGVMVAATVDPTDADADADAVAATVAARAFVGTSIDAYGPEYTTAVISAFGRGYLRTRTQERSQTGGRYFYGQDEDGDTYAVAVDTGSWSAEYRGFVSAARTLGPATWTMVDRAWLVSHAADEVTRWHMVAHAPDVLALIDRHRPITVKCGTITTQDHA